MAGKQRARPIRVVFSEKFRRSLRHIFVWPPWWLAQKAVSCHPVGVFEPVINPLIPKGSPLGIKGLMTGSKTPPG